MSEQTDNQITPFEFLQTFLDAPSQADLDSWKQQAPGRRLRLVHSSDGKRVYIMRGIGGQELRKLQSMIPATVTPENLSGEVQGRVASQCCVWTSATDTQKLTALDLEAGPAGLPQTLHEVVCQLSDYMEPETINRFSADL